MTDRERDAGAPDDELPADAEGDSLDEAGPEETAEAGVEDTAAADEPEDTIVDEPSKRDRRYPTAAAAPSGRGPRRPAPPARSSSPSLTPSDTAVHINDRVSKWFVAASVVVFILILGNAIFLGQGGFLSPTPTPRPSVTATPRPTATATPSASGSASPSAGGSASPSPSGSASPSVSPPASPSASPSPSPSG